MHYLFNETEIRFYKKYKLFPDELFQQLQNLGFSRESFNNSNTLTPPCKNFLGVLKYGISL